MLATDTSSLITFLAGPTDRGKDLALIERALVDSSLALPPVVLTELISGVRGGEVRSEIAACPLLEIAPGYWERAGLTRRKLLRLGLAAKMPDTLIAQSCIDHDVALITRDGDFRHFAKHCGLKLA